MTLFIGGVAHGYDYPIHPSVEYWVVPDPALATWLYSDESFYDVPMYKTHTYTRRYIGMYIGGKWVMKAVFAQAAQSDEVVSRLLNEYLLMKWMGEDD